MASIISSVIGCSFVATEDRQNLVYHYGIAHKVVFGLLKAHVDKTIFQLPNADQQLLQQHQQPIHINTQVGLLLGGLPAPSKTSNHPLEFRMWAQVDVVWWLEEVPFQFTLPTNLFQKKLPF